MGREWLVAICSVRSPNGLNDGPIGTEMQVDDGLSAVQGQAGIDHYLIVGGVKKWQALKL
jgi:hypothetical protein